jgi:hypothetical protein
VINVRPIKVNREPPLSPFDDCAIGAIGAWVFPSWDMLGSFPSEQVPIDDAGSSECGDLIEIPAELREGFKVSCACVEAPAVCLGALALSIGVLLPSLSKADVGAGLEDRDAVRLVIGNFELLRGSTP